MNKVTCHITYRGMPLCGLGTGQNVRLFGAPSKDNSWPLCGYISLREANSVLRSIKARTGESEGKFFFIVRGECPNSRKILS